MKRKASIFTKLVVLTLVVYATVTLYGLHGQLESTRAAQLELQQSVEELALENAVLEHEIGNRNDPEMIERIARGRFGLIMPGERTFYGSTN